MKRQNVRELVLFYSHRGGDEKKDKSGEKTPENQNGGEHDTVVNTARPLEMNHGTAVWMPPTPPNTHTHTLSEGFMMMQYSRSMPTNCMCNIWLWYSVYLLN